MSSEAARAVFAGSGAFVAVVDDLRTLFPGDFADAAYASVDGDAAWIAFQGAAPNGALGVIEALPFDVEIKTNFGISETECGLAADAALGAFSDLVSACYGVCIGRARNHRDQHTLSSRVTPRWGRPRHHRNWRC